MDQSLINLFSNIISNKVKERFSLKDNEVLLFSSILGIALLNYLRVFYFFLENVHYVLSILVVAGISYYNNRSSSSSIFIEDLYEFQAIHNFRNLHPEFFEVVPTVKEYWTNFVFPIEGSRMHFTDSIHNVKGYFALSKYTRMTDSKDGRTALGFVFCANEPFQSYVKKLEKYNSEKQVEIKELWFTKPILNEKSEFSVIKSPLYSSATSRDERYEKFMKTYFSENRDEIWNAVASVNDAPEKFTAFGQDARANILLHGPPGTGKTSLVNRIAITLNRHIVSLDITQFIHNRDFLYRTIYDGCVINGVWCNANRYIVLLEEFDMTVNYFTKRAEKEKEAPKIQLSSECETPLKAKPREFQLDDLLELLQGAIPAPGRILFATTNHFEKLLTILPSLFRPGRLTPVHCNNISWKSLQELTMFYFAKSLELTEPKKMNLCTAEILRIAMDCKINSDKPFEMFSEKIHEKLSLC